MKILLSAYACDPTKGSESTVGWNWAWHLDQAGHEVWVLTLPMWQPGIDAALRACPVANLHFEYVPVRHFAYYHRIGGCYPHYFVWLWLAYLRARKLHRDHRFDCVHHVTYVSLRSPTLMGRLGIPFIFGPLAGGDTIPKRLRKSLSPKARRKERLRDLSNWLLRWDPLVRSAVRSASVVAVTSDQTRNLLPRRLRSQAMSQLAVALPEFTVGNPDEKSPLLPSRDRSGVRIAYVGMLLYLKGLHLGFRAFAEMRKCIPTAQFTVIGRGPDEAWLHALASELEIADSIEWVPWMDRNRLLDLYSQFDLLLFPSLRDSGGMVVLEALSRGVPVVCLDLGGPGVMVDETCGRKIPTANRSESEVVNAMAVEMIALASDSGSLAALKAGAIERARQFTWPRALKKLYSPGFDAQLRRRSA
ncbi:MAG TPA: glycosyltransferase family 4 protein [Terracidiphilus sp.]|nr:glycosyltransferase family 4 protein [Terracidiphilus sp.]